MNPEQPERRRGRPFAPTKEDLERGYLNGASFPHVPEEISRELLLNPDEVFKRIKELLEEKSSLKKALPEEQDSTPEA